MLVERRSGADARRVITAMIVSKPVLGRIAARWPKEGLFANPWENLVGGWCCKYFDKYGEPPGAAIEGIYDRWANNGSHDKDTAALVEQYLKTVSGEYEDAATDINPDYTIDLAGEHFDKVKFQLHKDAMEAALVAGDLAGAQKLVDSFNRVELGGGAGIDILRDTAALQQAFEDKQEPLIVYPGALGTFFGDVFERDAFVAFIGPEKRGKTWWLLDLAWRGMLQRRKVAFFEVGDMSQSQVMRRLAVRAAGIPTKARTIKYPIAIERGTDNPFATVTHEERQFTDGLTWQAGVAAFKETLNKKVKSREAMFRLSCHPNSTISVAGIRAVLHGWERGGWVPDVVVCDYADILAPPTGTLETREQINGTWKALRALSQQQHCLVATATQADAASYTAETLGRSNFSEDKRKMAHVTAMIGLNATSNEKLDGVTRLNYLVLRESEYTEKHCCHVAGCLALGNPAIKSVL